MSVIIKKYEDGYWLETITHTPIIIRGVWQDISYSIKVGKIIPFDLKINYEYDDLYYYKTMVANVIYEPEFIIVERIPMYGKGDIITYVHKDHLNLYNRQNKLKRILQ